jgi:hypothetical protein
MATNVRAKSRPRRIASDEALSWARNLRLNNPYAKMLLCMLSLYVDGEGYCFVSIPALAEDTELSPQTVRGRLAWLEDDAGVIARLPQWVDELGRRNSDGKGRRTSDLIRLLIGVDTGAVEARVSREVDPPSQTGSAGPSSDADPMPGTGSAGQGQPVAPALTLRRPYDSVEGLISEPEPESPPKGPPPGDVSDDDQSVSALEEPEHFPEFWRGYPRHEVMSRYRALELFVAMTPADRMHARAAAPLLAQALKDAKRHPRDAHKWLAERGWLEFPSAKLPPAIAATSKRLIKLAELDLVRLAIGIAGTRPLAVINVTAEETGRQTDGAFWSRPIEADLAAMAKFVGVDQSAWHVVAEGSPSFAAWRDRLNLWLGAEVQPIKMWLEEYDPAVHALPGSDPNFKPRKSQRGLRVPELFPPRRDGTWPADEGQGA